MCKKIIVYSSARRLAFHDHSKVSITALAEVVTALKLKTLAWTKAISSLFIDCGKEGDRVQAGSTGSTDAIANVSSPPSNRLSPPCRRMTKSIVLLLFSFLSF